MFHMSLMVKDGSHAFDVIHTKWFAEPVWRGQRTYNMLQYSFYRLHSQFSDSELQCGPHRRGTCRQSTMSSISLNALRLEICRSFRCRIIKQSLKYRVPGLGGQSFNTLQILVMAKNVSQICHCLCSVRGRRRLHTPWYR